MNTQVLLYLFYILYAGLSCLIKGVFFDLGDTLVKEGSVETLPNAHEVLEVLTHRYKLAIICNTNANGERVREILKSAGIERYFDLVLLSSEVGLRKPDARIFRVALARALHLKI